MKKILAIIFISLLMLTVFACTNSGNIGVLPPEPSEEKNTLLFEIDEGIGKNEVTTVYGGNITLMENALNNIYESIAPLKEKYEVAVLIYPTWHYFRNGYLSKDPQIPGNRVSTNLMRALSFFEHKDMKVYLEMYSSGIRTSQNGEAGAQAAPPLYWDDKTYRKGISMDLDTVRYLKQEFPTTFEGIRFHELIGTNDLGLNDRKAGKEEMSHGFVVEEEVLYETFKVVEETGLKLVWGDHSWNAAFNPDKTSKVNYEYWKTWLDKCIDILGTDNLVLNWSNNGWPMYQYILEDFSMLGYRNTANGMSVQSWFWQELDSSTTTVRYDGTNQDVVKWYKFAENEMPIELIASYALKTFAGGGKLVQFEHPQYLFNYNFVNQYGVSDYSGYYESLPDYSGRLRLKRLSEMLLNPQNPENPSTDVRGFFDTDKTKLTQYKENTGAKRYYQTMVGAISGGDAKFFDRYNDNLEKFTENSKNRFTDSALGGKIKFATRFNANYNATTEYLFVKDTESGLVGEYYNSYSGKIQSDTTTFKPNQNGEVSAIAAINAISEYVESVEGDPDELIVTRLSGGKYTYELYKAIGVGSKASQFFKLQKVAGNAEISALMGEEVKDGVINVLPIKTRNALLKNCTKPIDGGAVALVATSGDYMLKGKVDGAVISQKLELKGEYLAGFTADINADCIDEIGVATVTGGISSIDFYRLEGGAFLFCESLPLGNVKPTVLFNGNYSMYYKASNAKAVNRTFGCEINGYSKNVAAKPEDSNDGLVKVDTVSEICDNVYEGRIDGKKVTSAGNGIVADYKLASSVSVLSAGVRVDLKTRGFLKGDSFTELYLTRGNAQLCVRMQSGIVGYKVILELTEGGKTETLILGASDFSSNEYDGTKEVFAVSFEQVYDIKELGKLNWLVKYNNGKKELRGKAEEKPFIDFLSDGDVSVGLRVNSQEHTSAEIVIKQLGQNLFYQIEKFNGAAKIKDGDISYSKIYLRWLYGGDTLSKATLLKRYDKDKKTLQKQIVFPSADRLSYTDDELKQGTQYCYELSLVDSTAIAVPKVIVLYEDMVFTTLKGSALKMVGVIAAFLVAGTAFVIVYVFLPYKKEKHILTK